jgi:SET domain-containing protein
MFVPIIKILIMCVQVQLKSIENVVAITKIIRCFICYAHELHINTHRQQKHVLIL